MKERESFSRKWKRILAMTLVVVIVLGVFPVKGVFAETDPQGAESEKTTEVEVRFTLDGEETVDAGEVQMTYLQGEEEKTLEGEYDEETNTTAFAPEITDPATTYTVFVKAAEGYQISNIIDEDDDSRDMMAEFEYVETEDTYQYEFTATEETKPLNLKVELQPVHL